MSEAQEDIGYKKYPLSKEKQIYKDPTAPPEPSAVCRINIKSGIQQGVKRCAWEFAEAMIKSRQADFVEWVK